MLRQVYWSTPKGPKTPLWRPFRYFNLAEPEKYGQSYLKNMAADAPELLVSCVGMAVATVVVFWVHVDMIKNDTYNLVPHKNEYVVVRPDNPAVEIVRRRPEYYAEKGHATTKIRPFADGLGDH